MATLTREPNGRFTVQVECRDGKRRSVRLGKVAQRQAESVRRKIADLEQAALIGDQPSDENRRWAASLRGALRDRLAAVGLVAARPRHRLAVFVDGYTAGQDVKPGTRSVYARARRLLVEHLGADQLIENITPADAQAWRRKLAESLSDNTVRRMTGIARQFFRHAVGKGWIESNPFDGLPCSVRRNAGRVHYVSRAVAASILEACPDAEWRLIFALARYAGLRCPSELAGLRWGDVDWAGQRFLVHSPKTEHHSGGETRVVPIFPDLLPYLRACFEAAAERVVHVTPRADRPGVNINPQMRRIVKRAGVKPWPKLFINLRSSCESDLLKVHPFHAVCAWLGHGPEIAARHYAQVTESDFEKAVQNPVQQVHPEGGKEGHSVPGDSSAGGGNSTGCNDVPQDAELCLDGVNGQGRT